MRNLIVCFFLLSLSAYSQTESLIAKNWVIDLKAMEPAIETRLQTNPNFSNLSEAEKKLAVQTALSQISKSKIEYRVDGTYYSETSDKIKNGKWRYDKEKNKLYVDADNKEMIYTVLSVNEDKLQLQTDTGISLFLMIAK